MESKKAWTADWGDHDCAWNKTRMLFGGTNDQILAAADEEYDNEVHDCHKMKSAAEIVFKTYRNKKKKQTALFLSSLIGTCSQIVSL